MLQGVFCVGNNHVNLSKLSDNWVSISKIYNIKSLMLIIMYLRKISIPSSNLRFIPYCDKWLKYLIFEFNQQSCQDNLLVFYWVILD